jgi:hypothetical protein
MFLLDLTSTEFALFDENGNISPDSTRAKSGPFSQNKEELRSSASQATCNSLLFLLKL